MTRAVVSGGGTAGHIYPALAVVEKLKQRGVEVTFVGTPDGLESRIVPQAGVDFFALAAAGFDRSRPLTLVTSSLTIAASSVRAWALLGKLKPAVVIGFGGYVSIPVGIAAGLRRIPLVIHEQNSVPGLANRFLAPRASAVALTYPDSKKYLTGVGETVVTGNPVRGDVLSADRVSGREQLGLPESATVLLVFGGSRGARHINTAVVAIANKLLENPDLHVIHVTGSLEEDAVREALASQGSDASGRWHVFGYLDVMGRALAAADLVVARAGATSIAEITALGVPAILVPYPHATDDHQTTNAAACVEAGAAFQVADSELDQGEFAELLSRLISDPNRRATMATASHELGRPDAAQRVADLALRMSSPHNEST